MSLTSKQGRILEALAGLVKSLRPDGLSSLEVAVRDNYLTGDKLHYGVTIMDLGEQYHDGTIGTDDVGHRCGIAFVTKESYDGLLTSDNVQAWRELIRPYLRNRRLPVPFSTTVDLVKEHVCRAFTWSPRLDRRRFPHDSVSGLGVAVWLREEEPAEA